MPRHPVGEEAVEKPGVSRVGHVRRRLEDEAGPNPGHHRRKTTQMIGVGVGDDGERERAGPVPLEKRRHHAPARIRPLAGRAGIHQHPMASRGTERRGIALPDVEKM